MRYPEDHKSRARARILDSASKLLRNHGIAGVSVATAMNEAGLTHGAFYAHFPSKNALVAASIRHAMDESISRLRDAVSSKSGRLAMETVLDSYLAEWQISKPWDGCPVAHLSQEVSRSDSEIVAALADRVEVMIDFMAGLMPDATQAGRVARATGIFAVMAGGVSLAGIVTNVGRRASILAAARAAALRAWSR